MYLNLRFERQRDAVLHGWGESPLEIPLQL